MTTMKQLRSKRIPVNIRLETGQTAELMAIAITLQASFRTALEHLAESHGYKGGLWLDDIERILLDDASNIWSEGLPIDAELRALNSGRALMSALTKSFREQLSFSDE